MKDNKHIKDLNSQKLIQSLASACVKCGLCLPHCPTYVLNQNECESPRGRIQLMKELSLGNLQLSDKTKTYLDHCLSCQACERVCPASVEYGKLVDLHHQTWYPSLGKIPYFLKWLITKTWRLTLIAKLIFIYKKLGIQKFMRTVKFFNIKALQLFDSLLTDRTQTYLKKYDSKNTQNSNAKTIILLRGCIQSLTDSETILNSIELLEKLGYNVIIPKKQSCCGALNWHAGDKKQAKELLKSHTKLLHLHQAEYLISTASGCSSGMKNIMNSLPKEQMIIQDILEFVNPHLLDKLKCSSFSKKVYVHEPCTLQNGLKLKNITFNLLQHIPDIKLQKPSKNLCCGAAGVHLINYNEKAKLLIEWLIDDIIKQRPELIVTSNIGCQLHFRKELSQRKISIPIMHPVTFLNQLSTKLAF